jgi:hypothetical protein
MRLLSRKTSTKANYNRKELQEPWATVGGRSTHMKQLLYSLGPFLRPLGKLGAFDDEEVIFFLSPRQRKNDLGQINLGFGRAREITGIHPIRRIGLSVMVSRRRRRNRSSSSSRRSGRRR